MPVSARSFRPFLVLVIFIVACAVYANLSFLIADPNDYRFFPPFERRVNANRNTNTKAEYFQMAEALVAGRGFADPFVQPTGPTAWQPPVKPLVMAALLWVFDGNRE